MRSEPVEPAFFLSRGEPFRFGDFEIDPVTATLRRAGVEVPLRRQTWQLLCIFAARPCRLWTKAELAASLWPRAVVSDDSLVQCVVELRRALGDHERRVILTVPRRGYRFEVGTEELPERPSDAPQRDESVLGEAWRILTDADDQCRVVFARRLFESNADAAGSRADAMAGIALSHVIETLNRWSSCPVWSITLAREAAEEAIARDPASAMAWHARAHVAMQDNEPISALLGFRAALKRDPGLARAHLRIGVIEMERGHPERTARCVLEALAAAPGDLVLRAQAHFIGGMAAFHLGRDRQAADEMRNVLALRPGDSFAHQWLASIGALQGESRSSEDHLDVFCRRLPGHGIESLRATERSRQPVFKAQRDRFYEGLRRAGLQ